MSSTVEKQSNALQEKIEKLAEKHHFMQVQEGATKKLSQTLKLSGAEARWKTEAGVDWCYHPQFRIAATNYGEIEAYLTKMGYGAFADSVFTRENVAEGSTERIKRYTSASGSELVNAREWYLDLIAAQKDFDKTTEANKTASRHRLEDLEVLFKALKTAKKYTPEVKPAAKKRTTATMSLRDKVELQQSKGKVVNISKITATGTGTDPENIPNPARSHRIKLGSEYPLDHIVFAPPNGKTAYDPYKRGGCVWIALHLLDYTDDEASDIIEGLKSPAPLVRTAPPPAIFSAGVSSPPRAGGRAASPVAVRGRTPPRATSGGRRSPAPAPSRPVASPSAARRRASRTPSPSVRRASRTPSPKAAPPPSTKRQTLPPRGSKK
jgi:hypothetical protein